MPEPKRRTRLDEKLDACPVCGSKEIPSLIFVRIEGYQGHLTYANCQGCGLFFLNPRMSEAQLKVYYQGDYRNRLLGPEGVDPHDQLVQRLRASFQAQVLTIWGVVPYTVLDVGTGGGFLLWEWDKRGAKVAGIEPDVRCHERAPANRYPIYSDLSETPAEPVELICMSHSLEHMNRPKEYLQTLLEKHAKKDTRLMIEVPNSECCTAAFRISHPMAFTRYTLEKMLGMVGYEVEHYQYHAITSTEVHRYLLVLAKRSRDAA